jgi:glycosyltransferase involved in cell wall biosynthesis
MTSPRILIVAPRLDIGGTEMHLARVLPLLRRAGLDVSVFVLETGGTLENELAAAGVPIYGDTRVMARLPHTVATLFRLAKHLRETEPDLVHCFLPRPYLVASFASLLAGHKRRIMSRRSLANYKRGHPILAMLEQVAHRSTRAFIGNSNAVVRQLLEEAPYPEKIGLIHNGVVLPPPATAGARLAAREALGLQDGTLALCIVASLFKYKGHADLLAALGGIRGQLRTPWRLVVIGRDEGIGDKLLKQAVAEGIADNIAWLGERSDVGFLLPAMDIALLTSHEEGFSNSLLETLAHGIPTIATAVGGNLDAIVNGETGLLVPPAAPDDLGEAILRLADDASLREELGSAGRARVLDLYSLESCVRSYENLYRNFARIGETNVQEILESAPLVPNAIPAPVFARHKLGSQPRIGYVPYSSSFTKPGDRRRFVAYARARNLDFEVANPDERYDLVVLSETADISVWPDYHRGKIVYDLIDSYLSVPRTNPAQLLRGCAWFMLGKHRRLRPDYLTSLRQMCKRADAVVCSTDEQSQVIHKYCDNVHIILDIHEMVVKNVKTDYSVGAPIRLVWEGLPSNLPQLAKIAPALTRLKERHTFELHVVTDPARERLKGLLGEVDTLRFLQQHFDRFTFHEWDEGTCSTIVSACDIALIPIDLTDPFVRGKPENKLLLLWRMGMPAIVAGTPAYKRAMAQVGTPQLACASNDQWVDAFEYLFASEEARREAANRGRIHAETHHGPHMVLSRWDAMFASLGYDFADNRQAREPDAVLRSSC